MKPQLKLKQYGSLETALKAANDRPFLRIGDTYLVPLDPNGTYDIGALQIEIIASVVKSNIPTTMRGGSIKVRTIDAASKSYKLSPPIGFGDVAGSKPR